MKKLNDLLLLNAIRKCSTEEYRVGIFFSRMANICPVFQYAMECITYDLNGKLIKKTVTEETEESNDLYTTWPYQPLQQPTITYNTTTTATNTTGAPDIN